MTFRTRTIAAAVVIVAGLASAGVAQANDVEKVVLWDKDGAMGVTISKAALKAGKVTFDVTNRKGSSSQHEMIVAMLTAAQTADPKSLPYDDNTAKVDEEAINDRGEVSELDPGQSGSLTIDLKPGTYMLFCNVAGHYRMGMYVLVRVA